MWLQVAAKKARQEQDAQRAKAEPGAGLQNRPFANGGVGSAYGPGQGYGGRPGERPQW